MRKYWLITDAMPAEVQAKTGLRGYPTPQGTLVERPKPFRLEVEMEKWDRALHPRQCSCAIIHMPPCKFAYAVT